MNFNHFLTSYMPDPSIGSKKHFQDMIAQSVLAEELNYQTVSVPEHHLVNLLMMPSPLQMAVKIASLTKKINITTSVAVLPLHDMRTYAGEVATADILTEGRLTLGVGRGAFSWEMNRLGSPINKSKEKAQLFQLHRLQQYFDSNYSSIAVAEERLLLRRGSSDSSPLSSLGLSPSLVCSSR